jgi:hypothetical protein
MAAAAAVVMTGASPCPHRYFPIEDGLALTYRAGRQEFTLRYSAVEKTEGGVKGTLSIDVKDKDRHGETEASCTAEGIKMAVGGLEGVALAASGLDAKVLSSEGVALPPEEALRKREVWRNAVSVELRPPTQGKLPLKLTPVMRTSLRKEAVVVGEEEVTVGSDTYRALKVKNVTTAQGGIGPEAARSLESTLWIAPGVGIIKVMTGDHVDLELLDVQRPGSPPQR